MEPSSSRSRPSPTRPYAHPISGEKFATKNLSPAEFIGSSCPICLITRIESRKVAVITACKHAYCIDCIRMWSNLKCSCPLCNAHFTSWYFDFDVSYGTFRTERLTCLGGEAGKAGGGGDLTIRRRRSFVPEQRVIRRSREEFNISNSRTRPLRRQRSFGQSILVPPDVIKERVLQWRTSIYEQHLHAVPCSARNCLEQYAPGDVGFRERLIQRVQPWIRRELQAVLGDPDPSIVVHVATSLFISSLERGHKAGSEQSNVGEDYLVPLRRFMFERTNRFWHELRCFAESSFNMETYDTVVEYIKASD